MKTISKQDVSRLDNIMDDFASFAKDLREHAHDVEQKRSFEKRVSSITDVVVFRDTCEIPVYEIKLGMEEVLAIAENYGNSERPFDFCATSAVEVFNQRRETMGVEAKKYISTVSTKTHWFKITHELTAYAKAGFVGKLQVFKR